MIEDCPLRIISNYQDCGELAEWLMAPVLKEDRCENIDVLSVC